MYKSELAKAAGVSYSTFNRWLHTPQMRKELASLQLSKQQKLLPPKAVEKICKHYVIEVAFDNEIVQNAGA